MKYIAFLRAINVGGHTVKMDKLRQLFQEMGLARVESFIASGNIIFESTSDNTHGLERQIEATLKAALGYEVATFIRSVAEVAEVANLQPFAETDALGNTLYIAFLAAPPREEAIEKLLALATEIDTFAVTGREAYWLSRKTIGTSPFSGGFLERTLGLRATVRNVTTVRKLAAKYA